MGFLGRIQSAAEQAAEHQRQAATEALDAQLSPDAPRPRTDTIRLSPRHHAATVAAYIGIVGLRPEDVYGIIPRHSNDVTIGYEIVYRDRPEYEAGRQAWAAQEG